MRLEQTKAVGTGREGRLIKIAGLTYRQDKDAGPAPFRSVSTPRAVKELPKGRRVYRRKMRGGSELRLGRLADRLCADLAREAWQGLQITGETAGLSRRDVLRGDILAEES